MADIERAVTTLSSRPVEQIAPGNGAREGRVLMIDAPSRVLMKAKGPFDAHVSFAPNRRESRHSATAALGPEGEIAGWA